jgi:hypothetical protein
MPASSFYLFFCEVEPMSELLVFGLILVAIVAIGARQSVAIKALDVLGIRQRHRR